MPSASSMFRGTLPRPGVMHRRLRQAEDQYEDALARAAAKRAGVPHIPLDALETGGVEPPESGSLPEDVEECVAAAVAAGSGDIRFADVVSPHTPEEFFAAQAERPHPVVLRGAPDRFAGLVQWRDIDRIICSGRRDATRIRVNMDAQDIPFPLYSATPDLNRDPVAGTERPAIDERKLTSFLRQGATLIVNGVETSLGSVADLTDAFARATHNRATANLYASWQAVQGFATHWDNHDVFVIQARGEKLWRIHGITRGSPLATDLVDNGPAPAEPIWTGRLTAGDVLYIPRGWWHDAHGDPERNAASIHLSCHVVPRTGANILAWLKERMTEHELFRRELPLMAGDGPWLAHVEAIRGLLEQVLRDSTAQQWARQIKDEYRNRWTEQSGARIGSTLEPWRGTDWDGWRLRLRGREHASLRNGEDKAPALLTANGVALELDPYCLPLIRALAQAGSVTVGELKAMYPGRFDGTFVDEFVKELVTRGVAAAIAPLPVKSRFS